MHAQSQAAVRLGIVTSWVGSAYWASIISGAMERARKAGAHALCFCLGFEDSGRVDARTAFYDLANADSVSGLIVLSPASFNEGMPSFLEQRRGLPLVTIGEKLPGAPGVWLHNAEGVRVLLTHLYEKRGYRRIAYVRGPQKNGEAETRYRAYEDFCVVNSIGFDPELVAQGDFGERSGELAAHQLLDRLGSNPPEAIVAANDLMALGVIRALKQRGLRVPEDVGVAGFDDLEGFMADPPLTTIRQPVRELGGRAVELVLSWLRGEPVPDQNIFAPELVVRSSCGERRPESFPPAIDGRATGVRLMTDSDQATGCMAAALDVLSLVENLRAELMPSLGRKNRARGEELFASATRAAELNVREASKLRELLQRARRHALQRLAQVGVDAKSFEKLAGILTEGLSAMTVDGLYVVLNDASKPDESKLVYGYEEGRRLKAGSFWNAFPTRQLLPSTIIDQQPPSSWVVMPFSDKGNDLGIIVARGDTVNVDVLNRLANTLAVGVAHTLESASVTGTPAEA